jgi:hypothetical protein
MVELVNNQRFWVNSKNKDEYHQSPELYIKEINIQSIVGAFYFLSEKSDYRSLFRKSCLA